MTPENAPVQPNAGTQAPCPACKGAGGFNVFDLVQGLGTTHSYSHTWIRCSLCAGSGVNVQGGDK